MSGLLAGKVWHSALHPDLKPLAAALADIADHDGNSIFPSVPMMAWLVGRSDRAIHYQLKKLKASGILVPVGSVKGGRHKTVVYRLIEANLPVRESWQVHRERLQLLHPFKTQKGATHDTKGCNLRQKRVQPIAPDPLEYPSITRIDPQVKLQLRKKREEAERKDALRRYARRA